jgi:hypothetical protein
MQQIAWKLQDKQFTSTATVSTDNASIDPLFTLNHDFAE